MSDKISIDPSQLTLGDLYEIEKVTGTPAGQLFPDGGYTAAGLVGVVYVLRRRDDPTFTFEDAKGVGFDDLDFGGAAPPTKEQTG